MSAPILKRVYRRADVALDTATFPTSLPFVAALDLEFSAPVTFFVGENGTGKSTLLEAIADLCGLPVGGGSKLEKADSNAPQRESELAPALLASFTRRPRQGYFFRAEFQAHFAALLKQRDDDRDFASNPFARYGGKDLFLRSHGEAFLAVLNSTMQPGLVLMDEPEAALSPQRQLALLLQMARLCTTASTQFVVATHSPILLTMPGAVIHSFDEPSLPRIALADTAHYQITRGILADPDRYWRHLLGDDAPRDTEKP